MKAFAVTRCRPYGSNYDELEVRIFDIETRFTANEVSVTWQADRATSERAWYGFKYHIEADRTDKLTELARHIRAMGQTNYASTPLDILAELKRRGYTRVVYDPRHYSYVSLARAAQPGRRYMDDYDALGTDNCSVACIAENADAAKPLLAAQFANSRYVDSGIFAKWVSHGCPVKLDVYATPPDAREIAEIIAL